MDNSEHSRFNEDHYKNCQDCFEDHLDFEEECRQDEAADASEFQGED